jgi:exodeoxyribonuclease VII large subunit
MNIVERRIYSVSEITSSIKGLLEEEFSFVWVSGEISNFRVPSSGHCYFTLKDARAQISGVMFRGQNRNLNFELKDGMNLIGLGRISVYEPRGTYQVIFEYIEPKGVGELQVAFEQLKKRLFDEGLFDERHKLPLPFLPKKISVITSPTGAVVHDILHVAHRRFPNLPIEIVPVKVQGGGADEEIVGALGLLNARMDTDVIILARGGGSLEDLKAFNSESVARALFASVIPVVSAVGHEIDYTISDFVADLRAPTPSAAAEMVVPVKRDLVLRHARLQSELKNIFERHIDHQKDRLGQLINRLVDPKKKIQDLQLKLDDMTSRLLRSVFSLLHQKQDQLIWRTKSLITNNPKQFIFNNKELLEQQVNILFRLMQLSIINNRSRLREGIAQLNTLNPMAVLKRGYSITRTIPQAVVVSDPDTVSIEQKLEIMVEKGILICRVERKSADGKKNL